MPVEPTVAAVSATSVATASVSAATAAARAYRRICPEKQQTGANQNHR